MEHQFSQALENPYKIFQCSSHISLETISDAIAPHKFIGDAEVSLKYSADDNMVLNLSGKIRVPTLFVCDRCGCEFEKNLFLELSEKVSPNLNEEEELCYDKPRLDPDTIIPNYVLVNFPSKVLCKADCKGLCSKCGANLNDGECECKIDFEN